MPLNPRTGLPVKPASVADAAIHIDRSVRTIYDYIQAEKLTRYRSGGRITVDLNEVDTLFALVADPIGGDRP